LIDGVEPPPGYEYLGGYELKLKKTVLDDQGKPKDQEVKIPVSVYRKQ
jgi:hypothetical protein